MHTPLRLPYALQVRLNVDQRRLLEQIADSTDTTLSGAVRVVIDRELDMPVNQTPSAPTRRQLLHEEEADQVADELRRPADADDLSERREAHA